MTMALISSFMSTYSSLDQCETLLFQKFVTMFYIIVFLLTTRSCGLTWNWSSNVVVHGTVFNHWTTLAGHAPFVWKNLSLLSHGQLLFIFKTQFRYHTFRPAIPYSQLNWVTLLYPASYLHYSKCPTDWQPVFIGTLQEEEPCLMYHSIPVTLQGGGA